MLGAAAPAPPATPTPPPVLSSVARASLATWQSEIDQADVALHDLAKSFGAGRLDDAQIRSRQEALGPIQGKLSDALSNLTPRLAAVDARLAQLGPAPAPGQPPEAREIAQSRQTFTAFHQSVDSEMKQAKLLQVEAAQLAQMLTDREHQLATAELWAQSRSILDPSLWSQFAVASPQDLARVQTILAGERDAWDRAARSTTVVVEWSAALLAALMIAIPLRLWLARQLLRRLDAGDPPVRLRKTMLALGQVLVAVLTPVAALWLARGALAGAITPVVDQLALLLIRVVAFAALFAGLGGALLAPARPGWRLAPISDDLVERLRAFPALIATVAAVAALVRGANTILGVSQPVSTASDCLTVFVELIAVGAALSTVGHARSEHIASVAEGTTSLEAESRLPWILAALLAWLTLAGALLALLTGYVPMAFRLMAELVWITTVLASLFLLLRFADDLFPALLSVQQPLGRFLRIAIGLSRAALEQISVLLSGVVRLLLLLFGWAAILAPFSAGADDVFGRITSSQLVIKLGQVSISPGAILGAVVVFFFGLFLTRAVRGWLEASYLPKTRMDAGLRASLASGFTYLGATAAVLLAFAYLGLSFDKIALFASALSVGIGFGLQSVVGNFVSGLILLAERPVKVGDWIAIGDLQGDVRRINVRATEIEMPDCSRLIVPNSDLISKTVRNVTRNGAHGQVKMVLKVVDTADPVAVRDIILARLTAHSAVSKTPGPAVYLSDVGNGAVEFTAFANVASPRLAYGVRSELWFQILPDLRARGVLIAKSVPIVNVDLGSRSIESQPDADSDPVRRRASR